MREKNAAASLRSEVSSASQTLFKTPFSGTYWRLAASELRSTKKLAFAAMMIALRVLLKPVKIPLGPYLNINTDFVVNAVGAMSFGPVVALAVGAITDTLGALLFPGGVYFFPFIFVEMAGALFFALMLYRTEITVGRVILTRFLINFGVNLVIQTPVMALYYQMVLGKYYSLIDLPRIIKNMALFPFEAAVLIVLLKYVTPPLNRQGFVKSRVSGLELNRRTWIGLISLMLLSVGLATGYSLYSYNTTSLSAGYTSQERAEKNQMLNEIVLSRHPEWDAESTVTVVESALPKFGNPEITYTAAVYQADLEAIRARTAEGGKDLEAVRGYSKSPAAKDEALSRQTGVTAVINGETGAVLSYQETP